MDQNNQRGNQSANQPSSQAQAYPANRWQPITDIYQQEIAGNVAPAVAEPPKPVPVPVSQRNVPKDSIVPMSLNIITGLYFVQAAVYLFLASRVIAASNSDLNEAAAAADAFACS